MPSPEDAPIAFEHTDSAGKVWPTEANTAQIALLHWYAIQLPSELPKDFPPFTVHIGQTIPSPDDPAFLNLCIAVCERNWNKTPPIEGCTQEDVAMNILRWLRRHGNILKLVINGQELAP